MTTLKGIYWYVQLGCPNWSTFHIVLKRCYYNNKLHDLIENYGCYMDQ